MTYLEVINGVLRRLREDSVSSIASDDYALMIGDFVNDAMKFVEDSWNFSGLRQTNTLLTVAGQQNYPLTSNGLYDIITNVFNTETKQDLTQITSEELTYRTRREEATNNVINQWAYGRPSGDLNTIDLLGIPTVTTELSVDSINRTAPLVNDTDTLNVPSQPVLYLALAYAARERGEVQGQPTAELFALADKYLTDAIAYDAQRFPNETLYTVV